MIDAPGGPFWWPEADRALADALKSHLRPDIAVIEMDCNVNDPEFARRAAETLLASMTQAQQGRMESFNAPAILHATK